MWAFANDITLNVSSTIYFFLNIVIFKLIYHYFIKFLKFKMILKLDFTFLLISWYTCDISIMSCHLHVQMNILQLFRPCFHQVSADLTFLIFTSLLAWASDYSVEHNVIGCMKMFLTFRNLTFFSSSKILGFTTNIILTRFPKANFLLKCEN